MSFETKGDNKHAKHAPSTRKHVGYTNLKDLKKQSRPCKGNIQYLIGHKNTHFFATKLWEPVLFPKKTESILALLEIQILSRFCGTYPCKRRLGNGGFWGKMPGNRVESGPRPTRLEGFGLMESSQSLPPGRLTFHTRGCYASEISVTGSHDRVVDFSFIEFGTKPKPWR